MARVAERLQVTAIREERPVPTVGHDVVHVRGPHSSALLGTGPAIGLTQELVWAEIVRPLRRSIQTVPCGAVGAALIFGLVGSTVAVRHQDAASWMPAWSQRLPAHGLSPPGKQKTPETMATPHWVTSWAPAFNALASLYVQDDLLLAVPAVDREVIRLCLRIDPQ